MAAELTEALLAEMENKAKEIFDIYEDLNEIYMTADLQGFTEEHKAEAHTAYLDTKSIQRYTRAEMNVPKATSTAELDVDSKAEASKEEEDGGPEDNKEDEDGGSEDNGEDKGGDSEDNKKDEDEEREALLAEYEALFGQKAPHNIGTAKLIAKIEEKKQN